MKTKYSILLIRSFLFIFILAAFIGGCTPSVPPATPVGPYMRMDPPPDSDKLASSNCQANEGHPDNSCWMHNAANMLAGAGYGNGSTVQARAEDIFADLAAHYNVCDGANGGWPSAAMQWWLASANNTWTTNPYTVVTTYGNTDCTPWANTNGAMDLGNELRNGNMTGIAIRWPLAGPSCTGGHAITAWGDDNSSASAITANPGGVRVTDSDTDTGGDVQSYTYDAYTNPNPGGSNEGNGWYFNAYGGDHPYIINIVTLSPVTISGQNPVRVVGSYKIQQTSEQEASDLHYRASTDVDILSYRTWLDWTGTPSITEAQPRREITVDWDLSQKKIPQGTWVTISTEFIEPYRNAMSYHDIHFTYPEGGGVGTVFPDLAWTIETPNIQEAEAIPNVTGGYIIGSFEIHDPKTPDEPTVQYRFVHQYLYNQSPEAHTFLLSGTSGFIITNLLFGHSYGYPTDQELWQFEIWMTKSEETFTLSEEPVKIVIDWTGKLPYPEGLK